MFRLFDRPLAVVDLEWNQSASHTRYEMPHEIIEIGVAKLGPDMRVLGSAQYVVRRPSTRRSTATSAR